MKCINCFREIDDNLKFCNFCGTKQPADREAYELEHPELFGALSDEDILEQERQREIEGAERLAQEEAERLAQEEAERLAQEEVERVAREEAERMAQEEAERRAREEAERVAQEAIQAQQSQEARVNQDGNSGRFNNADAQGAYPGNVQEPVRYPEYQSQVGVNLIACPECGQLVSPQAFSCPNCGCPIARYNPVPASGPYIPSYPPQQDSGSSSTFSNILIAILVFVIIILVFFLWQSFQ